MRWKINGVTTGYLIWVFSLLVLFVSQKAFPKILISWDAGHYLGIAEHGYLHNFQYAFFPLYPLLIKLFSNIFLNYQLTALLLNVVFGFLSLVTLKKLIAYDFKESKVFLTILFLLVFPTSFFLFLPYSESLFLFLSLEAFYLMRRKQFLLSAFFIVLASLTRLTGLVLLVPFLIELQTETDIRQKVKYIFISLLGIIFYSLFLFFRTGSFLYILSAEQNWQRNFTSPLATLNNFFGILLKTVDYPQFYSYLFDLGCVIFGTGLAIRSLRYLPTSYSLYAIFSILLPLFTGSIVSFPRFLLPIFPLFITLAYLKRSWVIFAYLCLSISLLIICLSSFIEGYWVS